ncbi:chymotrypsinogen A-like [Archocentrus centrarchus]|uniref:chymotrypsinogen A-like n=1 Tax=Archocentrus centrarchus TaxID=63155 RepID=UPI0011E9F88A|nr:chymotrypsinogen A-like [Archocentrus centrarchus]
MALRQFVCCSTVMFILFCKGCHSQQPACGTAVKNSRIMGGQDASPGSWPWQATLFTGENLCGGSLITNQWVLTAASCLTPSVSPWKFVFVGRHNLLGSNPNQMIWPLEKVTCHPKYNSSTHENDICLLKLAAPVNFTENIQPICLASENSTFNSGTSSWITGFGLTSGSSHPTILQEVNVPIVGNTECQLSYQNISEITDNMICAGLKAGGKNLCEGDLGGPLIVKNDSVWVQSGVANVGAASCANPVRPGVYVRVSRYQKWISETVTGTPPGFVTVLFPGTDSNYTNPTPSPTNPPTNVTATTVHTTVHSGENLIHFTHFTSLCALVVLLHVLVGSGGM